jgi:prepilin-type N-terminal cleavage/methylation domain-containing protein
MKKRHAAGFTLIETAIAIVVLGLISVAAINLHERANQQRTMQTTYDHMDEIVQALSVYAETAGRIPCPAAPADSTSTYGWERGVAPADITVGTGRFPMGTCAADGSREGIIPFMTLGLSEKTARDGWGRFFTYSVSPVFAQRNDQAATAADMGVIHGRCRHTGWVNRFDNFNRNAVKARFCCADQRLTTYDWNNDLVIQLTAAGNVISPQRDSVLSGHYNQMTASTTETSPGGDVYPVIDDSRIEAPAFALVSHGPNGLGAYLVNGTDGRNSYPTSANEVENTNNDRIFVDRDISMGAGAGYYDDIVRWMTQDGILAAHGALSCQYP